MSGPRDSYSSLERRFLAPVRSLLGVVYTPFVRALAALRITPNVVSFSQVLVAIGVVLLIPTQPRLAFVLFVVAIALDGVDGALARAMQCTTPFGALFDQYCDHIREIVVVSGLAFYGALNPFLAGLYGLTYPAFNLTLYLCNLHRVPLALAVKSYLVVYPAIFLYLCFGVNVNDWAVALAITLMGVAIGQGLWQLRGAMTETPE
jgi:phosphatidylglycerophosphate synthase